MSQHSYSYAAGAVSNGHPPPSLPQPATAAYPYAPYQDSPYQSTPIQSVSEQMSQHAYNQNRSLIPGLGFGLQGTDIPPQQTGPAPLPPDIVHPSPRPVAKEVAATLNNSYRVPTIEHDDDEDEGAIGDNELEEGELSEGEVEETYEPPQNLSNKPSNSFRQHQSQRNTQQQGAHPDRPFAKQSPRNAPKPTAKEGSKRRAQNNYPSATNSSSSPSSAGQKPYAELIPSTKPTSLSATTARKNAQDAILRLWPLNVRFSDYLNEGIDKQLLKSLFEELGLDIGIPAPSPSSTDMSLDVVSDTPVSPTNDGPSQPLSAQSVSAPTSQPVQAPVTITHPQPSVTSAQAAPSDTIARAPSIPAQAPAPAPAPVPAPIPTAASGPKPAAVETPAAPKDTPLEERKDRIARLLAAKGSKQAAAQASTPPVSVPAPASTAPAKATDADDQASSSASAKALSEKSRLLQQKMEALRKAREMQTAKTTQVEEEPIPTSTAPKPAPVVVNQAPDASPAPNVQIPALQKSVSMPPSSPMNKLRDSASPKPPTIPTGPRALLASTIPKRPAASDLNDLAETKAKRPFGHPRKPQPFLIDVSEDDDDAAMDLDSPDLEAASLNRPSSPFKIPSIHSFSGTPIASISRQPNTPGAMGASIGAPTTGLSKSNLESMNKEIEMMKMRIAEAEARKKARASRTGSPSGQLLNEMIAASSPASKARDQPFKESPLPLPSATPSGSNFFGSPTQSVTESPSQTLPKLSKVRNTGSPALLRSRAASERLPVVAARRKEQLLKLEALRSQVARIEKEIADSMQEEEALRLEALNDETENEEVENNGVENGDARNDGDDADRMLEDTTCKMPTCSPKPKTALYPDQQPAQGAAPMETDSEASSDEAEEEEQDKSSPHGALITQDGPSPPKSASADESSGSQVAAMIDTIMNRQGSVTDEAGPETHAESVSAGDFAQQSANTDSAAPSRDEKAEGSEGSEPIEPDSSSDDSSDELNHASDAEGDSTVIHHEKPIEITEAPPVTSSISIGQRESKSPEPSTREDQSIASTAVPAKPTNGSFVPYDSPLQYFHAYRFHPQYQQSVSGGLRSLTYSHKIDVKTQLCPDQLAGTLCPRGSECDYQHFESFEIPDDQILVQLGAYEGDRKAEYIDGLRKLLTEFRARKVKDFKDISQGILDYRAQFRNDKSKILQLGNVSL